jgi:hypothetical protein
MSNQEIVKQWIEDVDRAIDALVEWQDKLRRWQHVGCDNGEFHAALFGLRSAGLEGWADALDLDGLAEVVTRDPA